MVDFGTTLKEIRRRAGMTQQELSDRLWLSKATVSYYEQSLRYPSPEILVKISGVFHVSTDYLLGLEEKKQTLDVTDLPEEDIEFLKNAVELLRKKELANFRKNRKEREK